MTNFALWGTIVNTATVLLGALIGLGLKAILRRVSRTKGDEPVINAEGGKGQAVATAVQRGLGLCVLLIGIEGALGVQNMLVMILSVVIGAIIGELIDLDRLVNRLGEAIEYRMKGKGSRICADSNK